MSDSENSIPLKSLQVCAIPENTWATCWHLVNPEVRARLQKCYDSFAEYVNLGKGLYLWGDYGRGKTALASVLAKRWIQQSMQPCYWIRANEYPSIVIKEHRLSEYYTVADWCEEVPLLVIDEYQVRENVRFTETVVEELFRRRIDKKKSTIITTNVAPQTLEKAYPAMYAVLREGAVPVKVDGENKRVAIGEDTFKSFF